MWWSTSPHAAWWNKLPSSLWCLPRGAWWNKAGLPWDEHSVTLWGWMCLLSLGGHWTFCWRQRQRQMDRQMHGLGALGLENGCTRAWGMEWCVGTWAGPASPGRCHLPCTDHDWRYLGRCPHTMNVSLGSGMNRLEQSVVMSSAAQSFCPSKGSRWVQPGGAGGDLCISPVW